MRGSPPLAPSVFDWAEKEESELAELAETLFSRGWLVERHRHGWYVAWEASLLGAEVKALTAAGLRKAVEREIKRRRRSRV
jgi:hypothetical protein